METNCLTRKRIWEVDCWSLDVAIAASFDWKELINILEAHGRPFDLAKPAESLEFQAQVLIHEYCHSENEVSLKVEALLNEWHKKHLEFFSTRPASEIAEFVLTAALNKKSVYAGIFWALGSDSRKGFDCIRRRFHQRFQISSVRRLAA